MTVPSQPGDANAPDAAHGPKVAPTLQLSRRGLVLSLAVMVCSGLGVYALFPDSVGGPPLPVKVQLDHRPVPTANGSGTVVAGVVLIGNPTDHEIGRLGIEINGQYLLHQRKPLLPGETLTLPLPVFTDKRSSQRYDPKKYPVEEIVVTGQLPSGTRGVSKFEFNLDGRLLSHE